MGVCLLQNTAGEADCTRRVLGAMMEGFSESKFFIEEGVTFTWLDGGLEEASQVEMMFEFTVK